MKRQDIQILKADKDMLAREVDTVAQRLNEQVELMKNEITLELNNKKNETRMDHQEIDIKIQELNNKLTIKLSEFKMGLESVRLETIWKGLGKENKIKILKLLTLLFSWCSCCWSNNRHDGVCFIKLYSKKKTRK
jgi:hypothetical protein